MKKFFATLIAMELVSTMAFNVNAAGVVNVEMDAEPSIEAGLVGNGRGEPHYVYKDGSYATNCIVNIDGKKVYFNEKGIPGSNKLLKSKKSGMHYYSKEDGVLAENEVVISKKGNVFAAGTDGILLNYLTETDFADVIEILDLQDGYYTETTPYYYIYETQSFIFYVDVDTNNMIGVTVLKDCLTGEELEAAGFKEDVEGKYVKGNGISVYTTPFGTAVMF